MNATRVCQVCALTITMAIFAHAAGAATTYYVKNGGKDDNTGLSDDQAWATVDRVHIAFSAPTIGPGDSVLFKCGSKWAEQLVISRSGNNTGGTLNYITIGAYGSGARPIIGYDDVYSGWAATSGRTNVYEVSTSPEVHLVNETTTSGGAAGYFRVYSRKSNVADVETQAGSSYWTGGTLYVHAFDDTDLTTTLSKTLYGNTTGRRICANCVTCEDAEDDMYLVGAIRTNDQSYIKIQNIHAVCSAYGIGGKVTDNILVDDCRLSGNVNGTYFGHNCETTGSHDITTQYCEVRFNGNGLRHYRSNTLIAHDNTISDHWTRVSLEDQSMMAFQNSYNVQVYNNDISDGKFGFATYTESATQDNFDIHHNYFHGVIDRAVYFLGAGKFGGDLYFYHNVFWLEAGPGANQEGFRLSSETASSTEPYVIYNNTIHASQGLRMRREKPINLILKNNIFLDGADLLYDDAEAVTGSPHTRDFNTFYPVDSSHRIYWAGVPYTAWSVYQDPNGRDIESHGLNVDPDFVDNPVGGDNVRIDANGNMDDKGENPVNNVPYNPSTGLDFYGEAIGTTPSMGAAEPGNSP